MAEILLRVEVDPSRVAEIQAAEKDVREASDALVQASRRLERLVSQIGDALRLGKADD